MTTMKRTGGPAKATNKTTRSSSIWRSKDGAAGKASTSSGKLVFDAKRFADESPEEQTSVVKLLPRMGMRELINYALNKISANWKITLHANGMDIAKVLKAVELIKTRQQFLHQYNEFVTEVIGARKSKDGEGEVADKGRLRSGIKITLSKIAFDLPDKVGYQKPKPRIFMQPDRRVTAPETAAPAVDATKPKTQQRKQRNGPAKIEEELKSNEIKKQKPT